MQPTLLCQLRHSSHMACLHSIQYFTADTNRLASSGEPSLAHMSHGDVTFPARALLVCLPSMSIRFVRKKFFGSCATPPAGMMNSFLQSGQGTESAGCLSVVQPSIHWRQNVCTHGSTLGSLYDSRQIGHSTNLFSAFAFGEQAAAAILKLNTVRYRTRLRCSVDNIEAVLNLLMLP